ncbi:hypothetical protein D3C78_1498300 [compost metagenome]
MVLAAGLSGTMPRAAAWVNTSARMARAWLLARGVSGSRKSAIILMVISSMARSPRLARICLKRTPYRSRVALASSRGGRMSFS